MWRPWRALLLAALLAEGASALKAKDGDDDSDGESGGGGGGAWDIGGLEKSLKDGGVSGLASMLQAFSAVPDHTSEDNAALHIKTDAGGHDVYDFRSLTPATKEKAPKATEEEAAKQRAAAQTPAQVMAESQKLMEQMHSVVPSKEASSAVTQVAANRPSPAAAAPVTSVVAPVAAPVLVPAVAAVPAAAAVAAMPQALAEPLVASAASQLLLRMSALEAIGQNVQSEEQVTAARVSALEVNSRGDERALEEALGEEHGRDLRNGEEIKELRGELEESRQEVSGLRSALAARGVAAVVPAPKALHTSLLSLESRTVTQHHGRRVHRQRWTRRVMHHRKKPSSQIQ